MAQFEAYWNLDFDERACYDALIAAITKFVDEWTFIIHATAFGNVKYYPEAAAELRREIYELIDGSMIEGIVVSDAWQAWLEEYGHGSLMDTTGGNPFLADYITSDYWNPSRDGFAISGRPEGEYVGIDGEMHESSGKMEGLNLEILASKTNNDNFMPTPPTHFLSDALNSNRTTIIEDFKQMIANFPFGDFFIVK